MVAVPRNILLFFVQLRFPRFLYFLYPCNQSYFFTVLITLVRESAPRPKLDDTWSFVRAAEKAYRWPCAWRKMWGECEMGYTWHTAGKNGTSGKFLSTGIFYVMPGGGMILKPTQNSLWRWAFK